jgi:hypothetical protein
LPDVLLTLRRALTVVLRFTLRVFLRAAPPDKDLRAAATRLRNCERIFSAESIVCSAARM